MRAGEQDMLNNIISEFILRAQEREVKREVKRETERGQERERDRERSRERERMEERKLTVMRSYARATISRVKSGHCPSTAHLIHFCITRLPYLCLQISKQLSEIKLKIN
jgi:hypothetical protein